MKKYKVREYHKTGANKGNTKRELYFDTLKEADEYYNSVFVYNDFSLNPTVWEYDEKQNDYIKIAGY